MPLSQCWTNADTYLLSYVWTKKRQLDILYLKSQRFKLIKPADRGTPILLPSKKGVSWFPQETKTLPSAPPIQTSLPFSVCYPHFSRTPERLAYIQLKPLLSLLPLSPNSNVIIAVQPAPCLTINSVFLSPLPFTPFLFPCSAMPEGFKAWAPWDSGTTHCDRGTQTH